MGIPNNANATSAIFRNIEKYWLFLARKGGESSTSRYIKIRGGGFEGVQGRENIISDTRLFMKRHYGIVHTALRKT